MSPAVQAKPPPPAGARVPAPRRNEVLKTDARSSPRRTATSRRRSGAASSRGPLLPACSRSFSLLRERVEDILPLTEVFLAELGPAIGRPVAGVSKEAKDLLLAYPWPGNVRELKNALERAAILCDGGLITAAHLPISVSGHEAARAGPAASAGGPPEFPPGGVDLESMEKAYVKEALAKARFNKSKAAKLLGLTRAQLYSRIEKYGLGEEDKEFS